jgi:hypothetical protein
MMNKDLFIKLAASFEEIDKISRQLGGEELVVSINDPESRQEVIELLNALLDDIAVVDRLLKNVRSRLSDA